MQTDAIHQMPALYNYNRSQREAEQERTKAQEACVLLILGISEKTISMMTNAVASTVSNAKSRANEKLYGKKDASSLKNNLICTLRQ